MRENTLTNGAYPETGYTTFTHDQLPELDVSNLHIAATPSNIDHMADIMANDNVGFLNFFEVQGFILQNAGGKTLRCIEIVDSEWAFHCLAMANEAIKLAGGVLELAPYTVVRPMDVPDDDQTTTAEATEPAPIGMEVA